MDTEFVKSTQHIFQSLWLATLIARWFLVLFYFKYPRSMVLAHGSLMMSAVSMSFLEFQWNNLQDRNSYFLQYYVAIFFFWFVDFWSTVITTVIAMGLSMFVSEALLYPDQPGPNAVYKISVIGTACLCFLGF